MSTHYFVYGLRFGKEVCMYVAMAKPGRANIRIEDDIKADARVLAEMHRWDLSTLIRTLLNESIKEAKQKSFPAWQDAAKRIEAAEQAKLLEGGRAKVATLPVGKSNLADSRNAKGNRIQKDSPRRASGSGRKR
jgi:antitoxin component of RelBE/YafQ-DinJ toxin-antitoxin module